jgi:tetratricopeptide (TPR) repeat protein
MTNIARLRRHRGQLAFQTGDYVGARSILEDCVRTSRSISDELCVERSLSSLAATLLALGSIEQAKLLLEEALPIAQRLFDHANVAWTQILRGHAALSLGGFDEAASGYRESLELYGNKLPLDCVPEALEGIAWLCVARAADGDRDAVRLLSAAEALRRSNELPRSAFMQANCERLNATLRTKLGDAAYLAARTEGETLTAGQAVKEALTRSA